MNSLRFILVNKHNKEYNVHIYVQKPDRDRKVMDDLKKRPEHERQMFKRADGTDIPQPQKVIWKLVPLETFQFSKGFKSVINEQ